MIEVTNPPRQILSDYRIYSNNELCRLRPIEDVLIMKEIIQKRSVPLYIYGMNESPRFVACGEETATERKLREQIQLLFRYHNLK